MKRSTLTICLADEAVGDMPSKSSSVGLMVSRGMEVEAIMPAEVSSAFAFEFLATPSWAKDSESTKSTADASKPRQPNILFAISFFMHFLGRSFTDSGNGIFYWTKVIGPCEQQNDQDYRCAARASLAYRHVPYGQRSRRSHSYEPLLQFRFDALS